MNNRNNFYKVNHCYNTNNLSVPTSHFAMNNSQQVLDQQSNESSYYKQLDSVLKQWRQLQDEKKRRQQQHYQYDEFDRIMEEDLGNQLKELERQEEEQSKLMEQIVEEQLLEQDNYDEQMDKFKEEYIEQLKQIQEFEQSDEEQEKQQQQQQLQRRNNVHYKAFRNRKYPAQQSNKVSIQSLETHGSLLLYFVFLF